jgi:hypothetical protein
MPEVVKSKDDGDVGPVASDIDKSLSKRLQAVYYRQAYRMTPDHFWRLYRILSPHLKVAAVGTTSSEAPAINPSINTTNLSCKISCALRFFAGGDSGADHNVSDPSEMERCVWEVVDAIHASVELAVEFPSNESRLREIAAGFELLKSDVGIDACAGSLGSMLVWTEEPATSDNDDYYDKSRQSAYYNEHLNKYGLSLQAVCDHDGRFLHASADHLGSVTDSDAFNKSELSQRLKFGDVMPEDLALFGGRAYARCQNVVTPFDEPKSNDEETYNKYHLQMTEIVNSAFMALLRRWALLRRPMPRRFGFAKQRALALALVKLHNFCLDDTEPMLPGLAKDMVYGFDRGAFVVREPTTSEAGGNPLSDSTTCEVIGCSGRSAAIGVCGGGAGSPRDRRLRQSLLRLVRDQ